MANHVELGFAADVAPSVPAPAGEAVAAAADGLHGCFDEASVLESAMVALGRIGLRVGLLIREGDALRCGPLLIDAADREIIERNSGGAVGALRIPLSVSDGLRSLLSGSRPLYVENAADGLGCLGPFKPLATALLAGRALCAAPIAVEGESFGLLLAQGEAVTAEAVPGFERFAARLGAAIAAARRRRRSA